MIDYFFFLVAALMGYAVGWIKYRWPDYREMGQHWGKILAATIKCRRHGHTMCECKGHCISCSALAPHTDLNPLDSWLEFPTLPPRYAALYTRVVTKQVTGKWS